MLRDIHFMTELCVVENTRQLDSPRYHSFRHRIFYLSCELLSSVLSLTARINPGQVVKEFLRTKAVHSPAADSSAIYSLEFYIFSYAPIGIRALGLAKSCRSEIWKIFFSCVRSSDRLVSMIIFNTISTEEYYYIFVARIVNIFAFLFNNLNHLKLQT